MLDTNGKIVMNLAFPSDTTYPGMNLTNSNLLYAYLNMPTDGYTKPRTNAGLGGSAKVNASEIITSLNYSQIDGNTIYGKQQLSSQSYSTGSDFIHRFDFFNALQKKANKLGTNFNLLLELSLSGGYGAFVRYNKTNGSNYSIPSIVIGYMSEAGLYDYYTYESYIGSKYSQSYVSHNSGNLINIYTDYTTESLLNISHIYNSNRSHVSGSFGRGQRLNYEESYSITAKGDILLLNGDGSEVLFKKDVVQDTDVTYIKYLATDGSGDYFYKDNYDYYLITSDGVKKLYNSSKKLTCVYPDKDNLSKRISVIYTNNKIDRIIDTEGSKVLFRYNSVGLLNAMFVYRKNEAASEQFVFVNFYTYDYQNNLTRVEIDDRREEIYRTFEDVSFTYYSNNKLKSIKDDETHGLKFYYDLANRIDKVEQVIDTVSIAPSIDYVYDNNGRKLTLVYPDQKTESYSFDKEFHTKTVTNSLGYTSFTEYYSFSSSNPNYYKRHKVIKSSQPFQTGYNLINNHGFELPLFMYWNNSSNGGSAMLSEEPLYGNRSLILRNYKEGDTASVDQSISVKANSEYTLSGYIKNNNEGIGAYLDILSNDVTISTRSTAVVKQKEYTYYYIKFIPTKNTKINVSLVNESKGDASFDMISLNCSNLDTRYNFLQNSSFEDGTTGWSISATDVINNWIGNTF